MKFMKYLFLVFGLNDTKYPYKSIKNYGFPVAMQN